MFDGTILPSYRAALQLNGLDTFQRVTHLTNTMKTNWSEDPAARAAAKQTAGAVLVVEGLTGKIRSTSGNVGRRLTGRRPRKSAGGLFGAIMGLVLGVIFMISASFAASPDDLIEVPGQIVDVIETTNRDGDRTYRAEYSYAVDGQTYTVVSNMTSSSRPAVGTSVTIGYP